MKCGVLIFPGSNCDHDAIHVLEKVYSLPTVALWHKDSDLQDCDLIVVPGGFSYGDYLRAGAIARFSPIMEEVKRFASNGGKVLGICNGFQVLCEAQLLPGVLLRNEKQRFHCANSYIRVENGNSALTEGIVEGTVLKIPIAHAEGRYFADATTLEQLNTNGQILFRYCDEYGAETNTSNPNGSIEHIAGICNKERNVFGMMPHPERAADPVLGNVDGLRLFDALLQPEHKLFAAA